MEPVIDKTRIAQVEAQDKKLQSVLLIVAIVITVLIAAACLYFNPFAAIFAALTTYLWTAYR